MKRRKRVIKHKRNKGWMHSPIAHHTLVMPSLCLSSDHPSQPIPPILHPELGAIWYRISLLPILSCSCSLMASCAASHWQNAENEKALT